MTQNTSDLLKTILTDVMTSGEQQPAFRDKGWFYDFLCNWFRNGSRLPRALYFLFTKNRAVSNAPIHELLSLVRQHCYRVDEVADALEDSNLGQLIQFQSIADFREFVGKGLLFFDRVARERRLPPEEVRDYVVVRFVEAYAPLLQRTVVVDPLFSSCSVLLPPGVALHLEEVVAASGYIHSCGPLVLSRNTRRATYTYVAERIRQHLEQRRTWGYTEAIGLPFSVYSHEDFTPHDRHRAEELVGGLDEVKIYVEKYYVGAITLVETLERLKREFPTELSVAEPGEYKQARDRVDGERAQTIWLLTDSCFSGEGSSATKKRERHYICYEQVYVARNAYALMDENKPAWLEHTTMPHSLTCALLNVALAHARATKSASEISVLDPFGGTGTTLLEASRFEALKATTSDLEPLLPTLVRDNAAFFADDVTLAEVEVRLGDWSAVCDLLSAWHETLGGNVADMKDEELRQSVGEIQRLTTRLDLKRAADLLCQEPWRRLRTEPLGDLLRWAESSSAELAGQDVFRDNVRLLERANTGPWCRLDFYLLRRVARRSQNGLSRVPTTYELTPEILKRISREAGRLSRQTANVRCIGRETLISGDREISGIRAERVQSKYSTGIRVARQAAQKAIALVSEKQVIVGDACVLLEKASKEGRAWDIIITDPPYGVNQQEFGAHARDVDPHSEILSLYRKVIPLLVACVAEGGQLIIVLPSESYNGQDLAPYCSPFVVERLVCDAAQVRGRRVHFPTSLIRDGEICHIYWASERVLSRMVLRFAFD